MSFQYDLFGYYPQIQRIDWNLLKSVLRRYGADSAQLNDIEALEAFVKEVLNEAT